MEIIRSTVTSVCFDLHLHTHALSFSLSLRNHTLSELLLTAILIMKLSSIPTLFHTK